jgi:hypothetical protein
MTRGIAMMKPEALRRWFIAGLVAIGLALPAVAPADDTKDYQTHERQLQTDAKQIDADASRAANTPEGQRRVTERIARQFNVAPSVVTDLCNRKLGFGGATIALALSQDLMKQQKGLSQQDALRQILAQRQAGKGWGTIAQGMGIKLGHVVSEVKRAEKVTKVAKAEKADRPEKIERIDKPEKFEKPSKPEKAGR